jgi:hypothetical protein
LTQPEFDGRFEVDAAVQPGDRCFLGALAERSESPGRHASTVMSVIDE